MIKTVKFYFRASELEVENEKLRQDYQLLRNSIKRGVENQELEGESSDENLKNYEKNIVERRYSNRFEWIVKQHFFSVFS